MKNDFLQGLHTALGRFFWAPEFSEPRFVSNQSFCLFQASLTFPSPLPSSFYNFSNFYMTNTKMINYYKISILSTQYTLNMYWSSDSDIFFLNYFSSSNLFWTLQTSSPFRVCSCHLSLFFLSIIILWHNAATLIPHRIFWRALSFRFN